MTDHDEVREIATAPDNALVGAVARAELDQQITTARAFPRSLKRFVDECMEMATLNEDVASGCIYAMPRGGKTIEGPSVRLAEIVASAWGNCRAGARVVAEDDEFVTAQGVFHDLQRNVSITYEVRRRITDQKGRRYNADMIGVTSNAACSIALRNAVFKGVPKAFWSGIYDAARRAAVGDIKTLANKRADALRYCQQLGATPAMVFAALGVRGEEDIDLDKLATLKGIVTAIKDGELSVDTAFAPPAGKPPTDAPKAAEAAPPAKLTAAQVKTIEKACDKEGIGAKAVLQEFKVEALADLTFPQLQDVLAWIQRVARGG